MKKEKLMRERRQSVRFRVLSLVKHATEPDTLVFSVSNIRNISRGGLAFFTEEKLEGALLELHFLPPNRKEPVKARGKVVRSSRAKKNKKAFKVGLQFLDVSEDARLAIEELEASFLASQQEDSE